jgi:HNH endonuclease
MPFKQIPFNSRVFPKVEMLPNGCWIWNGAKNRQGYARFQVTRIRTEYLHRVIWKLLYGEIPNGMRILHHCDTPSCVCPFHLWMGTHLENNHDMIEKGRARVAKGHDLPHTKLNEEQVRHIRHLARHGKINRVTLAKEFGVNTNAIRQVELGISWKHV